MKAITMSRTLTEVHVKYLRPMPATRTWEDVTDTFYTPDEVEKITKAAVADALSLPTADYVTEVKARRVKATWIIGEIIKKAKLTAAVEKEEKGE